MREMVWIHTFFWGKERRILGTPNISPNLLRTKIVTTMAVCAHYREAIEIVHIAEQHCMLWLMFTNCTYPFLHIFEIMFIFTFFVKKMFVFALRYHLHILLSKTNFFYFVILNVMKLIFFVNYDGFGPRP